MKINEKIQEDEKKQSDVLKKYGRKDRHFRQRIICAVILLVLSAFFMILSALIPDFAEWYSEHVYPVWVSTLGRFSGLFPFSLSEILIYFLLLVFVVSLIRLIVSVIRICRKRGRSGERTGEERECVTR